MKHPENTYIRHIGLWHFREIVYSNKQNMDRKYSVSDTHHSQMKSYNKILLESKYSLCPSGSGPNSIRFWESLAVGSIPILSADTLELPKHELWDKAILRVKESDLDKISDILNNISDEEETEHRRNCLKIYNFFKDNYVGE
jgi:hypothetical protein